MSGYKFFVTVIEEKVWRVKNKTDLKKLLDDFLKGNNTKILINKI